MDQCSPAHPGHRDGDDSDWGMVNVMVNIFMVMVAMMMVIFLVKKLKRISG